MDDRARVRAYYASSAHREWERLERPSDGAVEFAVTTGVLARYLPQASRGPLAYGSVTLPILVALPPEAYLRVRALAWIEPGAVPAIPLGFSASRSSNPRPTPTPEPPDGLPIGGQDGTTATVTCDESIAGEPALVACAELRLVSHGTPPQLAVSLSGSGATRLATVALKATIFPWRSLVLTYRAVDGKGATLYIGRIAPDATGAIASPSP